MAEFGRCPRSFQVALVTFQRGEYMIVGFSQNIVAVVTAGAII